MRVRGAQTESSQHWDLLSTPQCEGWRQYAATLPQRSNKTGLPIKKQGFNAFCSNYDRFRLANPSGAFPMDAPGAKFIPNPVTLTVTGTDQTLLFTASAANTADQVVEILVQKLAGKNRLPQTTAYRTPAYHAFAAGGLEFELDLPVGYYACAFRLVSRVNGMAGPMKPIGTALVSFSVVAGGADEKPARAKKAA